MKKTLILFIFLSLFLPTFAFSIDIEETTYVLLNKWVPWREKVKLIDEIAATGDEKVVDTLVAIYNDGSLHFGCPSILYHTVNGLRYFRGNKKALRIVRDGIHYMEPEVRMISLEVLGVIGSEEDIDYLKPFLKSDRPFESH